MAIFLREFIDVGNLQLLTEEGINGAGRSYRIKGPFLQSEVKNGNSRNYPRPYVEREVNLFTENKINKRRALGELDHSQNVTVHLERASHLIESLTMTGNDAIGNAKIIDTPMGRIAMTLIDEKILLGVSSRSVGSLDTSGRVGSDLKLITVDLCADPSAPKGFVEALVENKNYIIGTDGEILEDPINKIESEIQKKYNSKVALSLMTDFLNEISRKSR
jgi:hypothetical protein